MDWATDDYTRTYADTFFLAEPDHDKGVYLLDEAGRDTDPEDRVRVPIRAYGDGSGRYGRPIRRSERATPFDYARSRGGLREGFYGNIVSSKRNNHAIFDAAWDERPMHYNPNAGSDWAHLVPLPSQRPYGGGPAPSLAFPIITPSEALNKPKDLFQGQLQETAGREARREARREVDRTLQILKVVLLVVIVVLLAMMLASTRQLAKGFERSVQEAVSLLRAAAGTKV
jgi:hypothetical protein